MKLQDVLNAERPLPAWAEDSEWELIEGEPCRSNAKTFFETALDETGLIVALSQWETFGKIPDTPTLSVYAEDPKDGKTITPKIARDMATALMQAADLLEEITQAEAAHV